MVSLSSVVSGDMYISASGVEFAVMLTGMQLPGQRRAGGPGTKATVDQQGVDDLVMLPRVGEQEIVDNLRKRYQHDLIYTYIGPVLISVNPYRDLNLTGEQWVPIYHGRFPHENAPHLYALAEEAYRDMKAEGDSQCILISGESGAGKVDFTATSENSSRQNRSC